MPLPLRPDPDRPESAFQRRLRETAQKPRPDVGFQQRDTNDNLKRALDIDAKILSPEEGLDMDDTALRLSNRHFEHLVSQQFISIVLKLRNSTDQVSREIAEAELKSLRRKANASGFFIERSGYTPDKMAERLRSPHYVIAEASGRHRDPQSDNHERVMPFADCQCWVPEASSNVVTKIEMPDSKEDVIFETATVQKLRDAPWSVGEVSDIAVNTVMNNTGLASAARSCAFRHIEKNLNPQRGEFPIERMTASIAQLTGIVLPDGTPIRLADLNVQDGVKNNHSLHIHLDSTTYPASLAYALNNRVIPYSFEYNGTNEEFGLLVNWFVCVHTLNK